MENITFARLTEQNFNANSMDEFIRYQEVSESWRMIDGKLTLVPTPHVYDWDLEKRRNTAAEIFEGITGKGFGFGAFFEGQVVGYIFLSGKILGSRNQYTKLDLFHISTPYRSKGLGRKLFELACAEARLMGVERLYISANPSKESQAAYRKLGCTDAEEIDRACVEAEPFDVQMEYRL